MCTDTRMYVAEMCMDDSNTDIIHNTFDMWRSEYLFLLSVGNNKHIYFFYFLYPIQEPYSAGLRI